MTDSNEVLENIEKKDTNQFAEENKNVDLSVMENQTSEKDIPEDPPPENTSANDENDNKELSQDAIKAEKSEDNNEENFKACDTASNEEGSISKNIGLVSEDDVLKVAEENVGDNLVKEAETVEVGEISDEKKAEFEEKEKINVKNEIKQEQVECNVGDTFTEVKETDAKRNDTELMDVTIEKPVEVLAKAEEKTDLQEEKQAKHFESNTQVSSETPQTNKNDDLGSQKTDESTASNLLNIMKSLGKELKKENMPRRIEKRELIIKVEKTDLGKWKATSGIKGKFDKVEKKSESKVNKFEEKRETLSCLSDTKNNMGLGQEKEDPVTKKITNLPDGYTDSSHSSSSEMQSQSASFETSQENNFKRINFENAIQSEPMWVDSNTSKTSERQSAAIAETTEKRETTTDVPLITIDDNTQPSALEQKSLPETQNQLSSFVSPQFAQPSGTAEQPIVIDSQTEGSTDGSVSQPPPTPSEPVPIIPPTPRKRGRPRKQVLPTPNSEAFECTFETNAPNSSKRSERSEKRQVKRKKFDDERVKKRERKRDGDDDTPKRRYTLKTSLKKKKKYNYIPKKKLPPDFSALENIQNFEEETRMSASEGPANFSSRLGMTGEESQGSSFMAEGQTKSSFSKKGRMEIMTDGCKPVTVQQIVEYCWPPPSQLPHGEKPDGLMIQEQISEYLGVKSFKRKYPSIKRRPVDMEERTYLQENGFVSENMCDMGLTAVLSSDILEIMYNDFPHKFEEYRKYVRDKKAKEQRALRERQAAERADLDPQREAVESAFSWNSEFNKLRREKRASCIDLQTFTVHFPSSRYKKISLGKPGNYPVALIPGQNTDYYKKYTSNELKYFPLNTVLYGPVRPNVRRMPVPAGSDGSQSDIDDSSSSDESSSSSSEETQDTEGTSSTAEEDIDAKSEKHSQDVKETPKTGKNLPKATPKGRPKGKTQAPVETQPPAPKKRLGRPPKPKPAPKPPEEETPAPVKTEKPDSAVGGIIYTCKMCREEETKNKNGEFESFIQCTQCHGKIHPSCIDLTAEIIPKISTYGWQCTDCKSCVKCGQSSNEDKMIFCDQCDRGYHIFCVGLSEVPSGSYVCLVCKPNTSSEEEKEEVKTEPSAPEGGDVEMVEVKEEPSEVKTENEKSEKTDS